MLSIINYRCKNYELSLEILKKSLSILEYEKPINENVLNIDIIAESLPNNQMRINPINLNLGIYAY